MMQILSETIKVRMKIRKQDPLASNLGHTFGHAIEKITNYGVNHGDAISVGIVMALEFSYLEQIITKSTKKQIKDAIEKLFNVKVEAINTLIVKGKVKRFRGKIGKRRDLKKAYVTLAEGNTIDVSTGL